MSVGLVRARPQALLQILGLKIETSYETGFSMPVLGLCSFKGVVNHFPELLGVLRIVNSELFFD